MNLSLGGGGARSAATLRRAISVPSLHLELERRGGATNMWLSFIVFILLLRVRCVCVCVKWWCVCALRLCVRSVLEFCIFIFTSVQKKSPSNHLGTLCALREQQGGGTGSAKTGSGVAEEDRPGAPPVGGRSSAW